MTSFGINNQNAITMINQNSELLQIPEGKIKVFII